MKNLESIKNNFLAQEKTYSKYATKSNESIKRGSYYLKWKTR